MIFLRKILFIFFLLICHGNSFARDEVTILGWWDHLDQKWVERGIQQKCDVNLAFQGYVENIQFLSLFNQNKWDIVIFESTLFNFLREDVIKSNIDISTKILPKYPNFIKNNFLSEVKKNTPNVAILSLNSTVFLYNPEVINITNSDTVRTIINKLQGSNKNLVLLSDSIIIDAILKEEGYDGLTLKNFRNLFNYDRLIVQNYNRDYKDLGAMIIWSGSAMYYQEEAKKSGIKLNIATIPRYSFITSNFIAQLNNNDKTTCVIKLLTSEKFLLEFSKESFEFSPYLNYRSIKNKELYNAYKYFNTLGKQGKLKWLYLSDSDKKRIYNSWDQILAFLGL